MQTRKSIANPIDPAQPLRVAFIAQKPGRYIHPETRIAEELEAPELAGIAQIVRQQLADDLIIPVSIDHNERDLLGQVVDAQISRGDELIVVIDFTSEATRDAALETAAIEPLIELQRQNEDDEQPTPVLAGVGFLPSTTARASIDGSITLLAGREGRLMLSARAGGFAATADPLVFDKEALRVGVYTHPTEGWKLPVDTGRIDRIVATFRALQRNGVAVDVTRDHSPSAEAKLGTVIDARREGDRLILRHRFADAEAAQLAARNQEVSVELEPEMRDGQGRTYRDALVASSIVRQPVVPNQGPFVRIAASRQPASDEPSADEIKAAAEETYTRQNPGQDRTQAPSAARLSRPADDDEIDTYAKAVADELYGNRS